jgi:hypothetical protein
MNDKIENLIKNHITRLQQNILDRDHSVMECGARSNPFHAQLDEVDLKNIASLREGRIPKYGDHMDCLLGDDEYDMHEFRDLTYEKQHEAAGLYAGQEPSLA